MLLYATTAAAVYCILLLLLLLLLYTTTGLLPSHEDHLAVDIVKVEPRRALDNMYMFIQGRSMHMSHVHLHLHLVGMRMRDLAP